MAAWRLCLAQEHTASLEPGNRRRAHGGTVVEKEQQMRQEPWSSDYREGAADPRVFCQRFWY